MPKETLSTQGISQERLKEITTTLKTLMEGLKTSDEDIRNFLRSLPYDGHMQNYLVGRDHLKAVLKVLVSNVSLEK